MHKHVHSSPKTLPSTCCSAVVEDQLSNGCAGVVALPQGATWQTLVFATPLFFGVCHLHHAWGLSQVHGPSGHIMALCFLQFLYTTVFGWYATWVFLCTGSILASMLVHSLCNIMGLPPFSQMGWLSLALTVCGVLAAGVVLCLLPSQASKDHHFWWRQQPLH